MEAGELIVVIVWCLIILMFLVTVVGEVVVPQKPHPKTDLRKVYKKDNKHIDQEVLRVKRMRGE